MTALERPPGPGQPSRIYELVPYKGNRDDMRPMLDVLEHAVRVGATVADACGLIYPPLDKSTWRRWQSRGRVQHQRMEAAKEAGEDYEVPAEDYAYYMFYTRLQTAQLDAKVEALDAIRDAIIGYEEIEETVREVETPITVTNHLGDQEIVMSVERTTTRKRSRKRHWAAAMTWLERRYGNEYARRSLEAVLAGDVEDDDQPEEVRNRALELADQLAEKREQRARADELASTDVIDV